MKPKSTIEITSNTTYNNGYIGAGIVKGAKVSQDVVGFRIVRKNSLPIIMDMTLSEALDLSAHLTIAVNQYLLTHKTYIPNK